MKKHYFICVALCLLSGLTFSQRESTKKQMYLLDFDAKGNKFQVKKEFKVSNSYVLLKFNSIPENSEITQLFGTENVQLENRFISRMGNGHSYICTLPNSFKGNTVNLVKRLSMNPKVESASYFISDESNELSAPLYNLFAAPNEETMSDTEMLALIAPYNGKLSDDKVLGRYEFTISKDFDPIDAANELFETGHFRFCQPNKLNFGRRFDLDYSGDQWYIDGDGATGDTKIDQAWDIPGAKRGDNITIAVIDDGVQAHVDLSGQLVAGYDAIPSISGVTATGGAGSNSLNIDAGHGTNVTGCIVGANNYYGVKGVAYNAKVMPIRAFYYAMLWDPSAGALTKMAIFEDAWAADAILAANTNGADIISCSWGGGISNDIINDAIEFVIINGRSSKGIPVFFSSGNYDDGEGEPSDVIYPANQPLVISVGSTSKTDNRSAFSCFGSELDIVAPGEEISTTDISSAVSGSDPTYDWDGDGDFTDDPGVNGSAFDSDYSDFTYTKYFRGTSAACPIAAGIMALILSNGPNLTEAEAREILETTCDKPASYTFATNLEHPNGTWNIQMGHGRVNALKAVEAAMLLSEPSDLGGASIDHLELTELTIHNNTCYNEDYPTVISWDTEVSLPHDDGLGTKFIPHALVYSDSRINTNLSGIYSGGAMEAVPLYPKYYGGGDSPVELTPAFYDGLNSGLTTFPVDVPIQLQLSARHPLILDLADDNYVIELTYDFTAHIDGLKLQTSATEANVCNGDNLLYGGSVNGSGTEIHFTVQRKVDGAWIDLTSPALIAGGFLFSISPSKYDVGTNYYRVRAENNEGCIRKSKILTLFVSEIQIVEIDYEACLNDVSIPLNIEPSGGVGEYTAVWSPVTYLSDPFALNPLFNPTGAVSTSYTVVVTDEYGCTKTENVYVEVHAPDFLSITAHADPDIVCRGGDSELTGSAASGYGPPFIFIWSDDLGNELDVSTSLSSYDVENLDETTTYTYTIFDKFNCTASDNVTVFVDPTLGPSINDLIFPEICSGGEVVINPTVNLPIGEWMLIDLSYSWSNGSGDPSITVNDLVTTDHVLNVMDPDGCYSERAFTIVRNPALGPTISLNWDNEFEICRGENAEVSSIVTGGTLDYNYLWSTGDATTGIITTETSPNLTVTDAAGCISSESIEITYPGYIQVMQNHPLTPLVYEPWGPEYGEERPSAIIACKGEVVNTLDHFNYYGGYFTGGMAPYTTEFFLTYYVFGAPDIVVPVGSSFPMVHIPESSGEIGLPADAVIYAIGLFVEIYDVNGCQSDHNSTYPTSHILDIRWPEELNANFVFYESPCTIGQQIEGCLNFTYGPYNASDFYGGVTTSTVLIKDNTGFIVDYFTTDDDHIHEHCVTFDAPGNYEVTVTFTSPCEGTVTNTEIITVGDVASDPLFDNVIICSMTANQSNYAKHKVETSATCAAHVFTTNHVRYIAGETVILNPGFHTHYTSDYLARIDNCLLNKSMSSTWNNSEEDGRIKVYPNPTSSILTVEYLSSLEQQSFVLYDVLGKVVLRTDLNADLRIEQIDVSELMTGTYIYAYQVEGIQVETGKLIVE